jgi:peptide/nickel transport system permease protein
MSQYIMRRVFQIIPVFIGITFITFLMISLAPGDPVVSMYPSEVLDQVDPDVLREQLGLNEPVPIQYFKMMSRFFTGELESFQERRPVLTLIVERLFPTILFAALSVTLALLIGLPVAILSAIRPYSVLDHVTTMGVLLGLSLPRFWIALILSLIFSEWLRWLPSSGIRPIEATGYSLIQMFPYLILPTIVLTIGLLPPIVRYARSSMIDVLAQDYIRTAYSKGLPNHHMLVHHALRNAILPLVTLIGATFPILLGGAVLVETIFGIPGIGWLAVRAALTRDIPVILTLNIFTAFMVLISSLLTDIVYTMLDPRVRLS